MSPPQLAYFGLALVSEIPVSQLLSSLRALPPVPPEQVAMLRSLIPALINTGQYQDAVLVLEILLSAGNVNPENLLSLALCLTQQGEGERAAQAVSLADRLLCLPQLPSEQRTRLGELRSEITRFLPGGVLHSPSKAAAGWSTT